MNTTTAATQAGVTRDTIRTWARMGAIRATKTAGRWVIDSLSLARRIAMGTPQATTEKKVTMKETDIDITVEGARLYLTAPYNSSANSSYKTAGGRWDGSRKSWRFAARDIDRVRDILNSHFGYDDRPVEVVDVQIDGEKTFNGNDQEWFFGGRRIAFRRGRDEDVYLAENVILIEGAFPGSGGSVNNPRIDTDEVVLEIRDVPKGHPDLQDEGVTVLEPETPVDTARAALIAERAALVARLAEIDAQLAQ